MKVNINLVLRYSFYVSYILNLTQSSNMIENIDNHRLNSNERVMELQEKKGKNSRMLTKEHYVKTVERLKILENPMLPRTLPDHNLLRRFGLLRVESGNNMVEKLVKPGTNLRFARALISY